MEQVRQIIETSTEVQTYAASDAGEAQWPFTLFGEQLISPIFLKGNTFVQSFLAKKKGAE